MPRCSFCSGYHGRFFMCLICSSVTCCTTPESNHALLHSESFGGHEICVDMERAELYCCVCCDQVYDPEFDKAVVCKHMMGLPRNGNGLVEGGDLRLSKRKRLDFGADLDSKSVKRLVLRRKQSWWQHSENLASYEQQDAHEFFISMLDRIHEKLGKASLAKENGDCQCIAHRVFSGLLRSDVTCTSCGFTSSTYDPCVDISLDLNNSSLATDFTSKPSKLNETSVASSLVGCLDLFTRPEKLGSDQKLYCEKAGCTEANVSQ
ncbi:UNVERIFIED_CONTAM: Ubiquitin C-terminal hydrolase 22 [Sesamum radiatum]|uniref:Ubiquitin C-terminal hydrolase 22 n=1 Tax=Sesamum radiatum TaxID=300843 RepID=A0AAW2TSF1_SESRA